MQEKQAETEMNVGENRNGDQPQKNVDVETELQTEFQMGLENE